MIPLRDSQLRKVCPGSMISWPWLETKTYQRNWSDFVLKFNSKSCIRIETCITFKQFELNHAVKMSTPRQMKSHAIFAWLASSPWLVCFLKSDVYFLFKCFSPCFWPFATSLALSAVIIALIKLFNTFFFGQLRLTIKPAWFDGLVEWANTQKEKLESNLKNGLTMLPRHLATNSETSFQCFPRADGAAIFTCQK